MKVDMSPQAIENRLRLVGELTRACLLIRRHSAEKPTTHEKPEDPREQAPANDAKRRSDRVKKIALNDI